MAVERVMPILPSRSLDETLSFYQRLGFLLGSRDREPNPYLIIHRGPFVLHFFEHTSFDPSACYSGCYVRVGDSEAVYKECLAAGLPHQGIPRLTPIRNEPWGMQEFAVIDPSGNLIRIGSELKR